MNNSKWLRKQNLNTNYYNNSLKKVFYSYYNYNLKILKFNEKLIVLINN